MTDLITEAIESFRVLYEQARRTDIQEPTAMTLATAGKNGRPSSRTVLLKGFDSRGFVFYTNLDSRKARQLTENPWASLTFYWPVLERQVQIEGAIEAVDEKEADAYWATRPRESQIGAWASHQSQPLAKRDDLLLEAKRVGEIYEGRDVPRPPRWSGFRLIPDRIEFWKGMPARLHERIAYARDDSGTWTKTLLNP
ncbi:MAG TPA: pyridoxamine 5'-phosphate oxidase [bacterium]|nr:pyridoxamine 5'-phosphate oxidase [bacterium]